MLVPCLRAINRLIGYWPLQDEFLIVDTCRKALEPSLSAIDPYVELYERINGSSSIVDVGPLDFALATTIDNSDGLCTAIDSDFGSLVSISAKAGVQYIIAVVSG